MSKLSFYVKRSSVDSSGYLKYPLRFIFDREKRRIKMRYTHLGHPFDQITQFSFDDFVIESDKVNSVDDLLAMIDKDSN